MREYTKRLLTASLFFFLSTCIISAQVQVVEVDYMRIPVGGEAEYLAVEQLWKPMHQELKKQEKLLDWILFQVPYPGGSDAEYHYVTARLYKDLQQAAGGMTNLEEIFTKVHPGKDINTFAERTLKSRELVKTHSFWVWESFFDPEAEGNAGVAQQVYFKVPMEKWGAYMEMERKHFHPTHKAEVEAGARRGWAGLQLRRPFGMDMPYQFVAVDFYNDYQQYISPPPEGLFEKVFPDGDPTTRDKIFYETVKLVKLEEWRLVDATE